jgi:hypothetical protein
VSTAFSARVRDIVPLLIPTVPGMPDPDPERLETLVGEFLAAGTPAFRLLYRSLLVVLQLLCLLKRRKPVHRLTPPEGEEFVASLYAGRTPLLRAIPKILELPLKLFHYDRDDVQAAVGFQVDELRREAALREVKR